MVGYGRRQGEGIAVAGAGGNPAKPPARLVGTWFVTRRVAAVSASWIPAIGLETFGSSFSPRLFPVPSPRTTLISLTNSLASVFRRCQKKKKKKKHIQRVKKKTRKAMSTETDMHLS